jgi:hypothetical protein
MASRGLFAGFAVFLSFLAVPALAASSSEGELFPVNSLTIPGALPSDGVAPAVPRSVQMWQVTFGDNPAMPSTDSAEAPGLSLATATAPATDEQRPTAYVYSDGYNTRRKIHMVASYLTLPLFAFQAYAGQKLYNEGTSSAQSLHDAGMALTIGLFTVNTVTGGWNFLEARKDPNGKTRRLVHSLMMFGADIGFVATAALAPDDDEGGSSGDKSLHRAMAISSMSVAAASYIYMFVTR